MFEDLIPELRPFARELVDAAGRAGLLPRVTSTRRSHALQKKLYDRFLAGAAQYPVLPPGQSAHEFGFAFDMVVSPMSALEDVGYTWQQWGGLWGGTRDPVHFEYPGFVPPDTGVGFVPGKPDPTLIKLCDFVSGFTPGLGELELGEMIAQWIDPIPPELDTFEARVSKFLQGPCSAVYRRF